MKTRILISSLVLALGFLVACSKGDKTETTPPPATVNGTYTLINVSGGLQGANVNFTSGEIFWSFDASNQTLAIQNTIAVSDNRHPYSDLPSGNYSYKIQTQGTQQVLVINTDTRGPVILKTTGFTLDDGLAVDGFLLEFEQWVL